MQLNEQERRVLRYVCTAAEILDSKLNDVVKNQLTRKPSDREEDALFKAWFHQGTVAKNIRIALGEEGVVDEP